MKKLIKEEKGSVLVIFVLLLAVFVGMSAVVTNLGSFYLIKSRMQNAVDAAALAGAQEIASGNAFSVAQNTARTVAGLGANGGFNIPLADIKPYPNPNNPNSATGVTVNCSVNKSYSLPSLLGLGSSSKLIPATATAQVYAITGLTGAAPIGVPWAEWALGEVITMKDDAGNPNNGNPHQQHGGNFGFLALGGNGANVLRDNLATGYPGLLSVGDVIDTQPGNISSAGGPVNDRIDACNDGCTWDNFEPGCPRLFLVPIIDELPDGGRTTVTIVGFAYFFVDEKVGNGSNAEIKGHFVQGLASGTVEPSQTNYGLSGVKLIN